jgi:hypothetical protein
VSNLNELLRTRKGMEEIYETSDGRARGAGVETLGGGPFQSSQPLMVGEDEVLSL